MRNKSPSFNGYEQGPDFDRARSQIATPFQYLDIALDVAATNSIFNISGDFLYLDAASTGVVTLELNNQYNDASAPFYAQAGFGLQALFKQVKLSWTAQAGKRVRLMYSTGDRVVPTNSTTINGTVNTVDAGLTRTLANQAFLDRGYSPALAGNYSHNQIYNPVGSGKNVMLESISIFSPTAGQVDYGTRNAALSTLYGPSYSKLMGGANGVAVVRAEQNAASLITSAYASVQVAANTLYQMRFTEPIVIPPGWGFVIVPGAVNVAIFSAGEHFEQ